MRAVFIVAVLLAGWVVPAWAQIRCAPRAQAVEFLARNYSEFPVADGLTHQGGRIEVFATIDGATWTILITFPNGVSCFVDAGENWEMTVPGQPIGE